MTSVASEDTSSGITILLLLFKSSSGRVKFLLFCLWLFWDLQRQFLSAIPSSSWWWLLSSQRNILIKNNFLFWFLTAINDDDDHCHWKDWAKIDQSIYHWMNEWKEWMNWNCRRYICRLTLYAWSLSTGLGYYTRNEVVTVWLKRRDRSTQIAFNVSPGDLFGWP